MCLSCKRVVEAVLAAALATSAVPAWAQQTRVTPATTAIVEYRVQQGDTLFALLRDGADWQSVQRANNIADPKRLQPGSPPPLSAPRCQPGWLARSMPRWSGIQ